MQISEVMTATPQSARSSDSLRDVAMQMNQGDFGSMPVLDDGRVVGVVTDRDIVIRGVAQGLTPEDAVEKVMTSDVVCVAPDCDIQEAAQMMQERQIRRLYVTEGENLVGVVAMADVAEGASDRLSGETIEKISQS